MKFNCSTPKELMSKTKDLDLKMIDLRFTDMPGTTHHISIPIKLLMKIYLLMVLDLMDLQ